MLLNSQSKNLNILIVVMPVVGHVNAVLRLAKTLITMGNKVYFSGGIRKNIDEHIIFQGFSIVDLTSVPFGLNFSDELCFYRWKGKFKKNLIYDRYFDLTFRYRCDDYQNIINSHNINYIYLDSFLGSDFLCLKKVFSIKKVAFINTMASVSNKATPPLNFGFYCLNNKYIRYLWMIENLKKGLYKLRENIFLLGKSTNTIIKKKIKELKLDSAYQLMDNSPVSKTFKCIPEYILSWPEFEIYFKNNRIAYANQYQFFLGPQIDRDINYAVSKDDMQQLKDILLSDKIIYISFGTLNGNDENKKLTALVRKIIKSSWVFKDYIYIFSGKEFSPSLFSLKNNNVYIFNNAPQQIILSKSKLFITHGGLNSIKESIDNCVPMLVIPINQTYDQVRNAINITKNNLGLMGHLENIGYEEILKKMNFLISHSMFYSNISKLKIEIDQTYTQTDIETKLGKNLYNK